jgi:predicted outer membrane repeat protein
LLSYFCDTTLTDSTFSGNQADAGAGIVAFASNITLEGCEVTANVASEDVGGLAAIGDSSTTLTMTDTRFEDNEAQNGGGAAIYLEEMVAVISGTGPGTCVFHGNTTTGGEGGAILMEDSTVEVTGCDFGAPGTAGDNSEGDIFLEDADRTFDYGEGETFSCDDTNSNLGICTPGTYDIEVGTVTTNRTRDGHLRGNIIDITSTLTLNSFAMWLDPQAGCNSLDMYLMTSPDLSAWTLQWSDTVSTTTSNAGWQESGAVGVALSSGQYIAAIAGWTCSVTYYYSSIGDLEFPFGTVDGNVGNSSYSGLSATPWAESGWYGGVNSSLRYKTTYNVTQ